MPGHSLLLAEIYKLVSRKGYSQTGEKPAPGYLLLFDYANKIQLGDEILGSTVHKVNKSSNQQ